MESMNRNSYRSNTEIEIFTYSQFSVFIPFITMELRVEYLGARSSNISFIVIDRAIRAIRLDDSLIAKLFNMGL